MRKTFSKKTTLAGIFVFSIAFCLATNQQARAETQTPSLKIDVHAHIFNGEDVPLDGFIEEIVLKTSDDGGLKVLLRALIRPVTATVKLWADGEKQENRQLSKALRDAGHPVPPEIEITTVNSNKAYGITQETKKQAKKRFSLFKKLLKAARKQDAAKKQKSAKPYRGSVFWDNVKIARWLRNFTAPRKKNMESLLKNHGKKGKIDLFVTALVDLDYWLKGKTKSHMEQQVLMSSKLSILSNGRILPFVSFDPYRDVVENGKALALVKLAIMEYGFVGVKLYPPMGFKAIGNNVKTYESVENGIWRKPHGGIPALSDKDFAKGIETSLMSLYDWAEKNDVPIMAHANDSNFSRRDFCGFANPQNWQRVLEQFPRLRINLGHFGGTDSFFDIHKKCINERKTWAQKTIDLLETHPNLYADTGNFKLRKSDGFHVYLAKLKAQLQAHPKLAGRLMYGSDWFMNSARSYSKKYPQRFQKRLKEASIPAAFSRKLMGENAVKFLGLKNGNTRKRLKAFYQKYNVKAAWLKHTED